MRHLLLICLSLPLVAAASPAIEQSPPAPGARVPASTAEPACPDEGFALVREGGKPEVNSLGELPSGSLILSVFLEENGCTRPVVVRHGFGASEEEEAGAPSGPVQLRQPAMVIEAAPR